MKRVVVTGLGAITPIGNSVSAFWEGLSSGKSGAGPITQFDASKFKTKFACEVKDFKPEDHHIDRREARRMDRFTQFAMAAAIQAVSDCGAEVEKLDLDRVGVIWGAGIGGIKTLEEEIENFILGDGTPRYSPFLVPKHIVDIAAGLISIKYGFRGPNYATVSACASSAHALIAAFDLIRLGKADMIVTGGSEASVAKMSIGGFNALKALSERNNSPETASRPFDKDRDGFVLGEGGVSLILEEYEHAVARGAHIYCEVAGTGMSGDAYHMTAPHPEGTSVANCMKLAMQEAGIGTQDVDYINVHGTSTPLGDIAEIHAIKKVFGDDVYGLNISSTKSMTGHLLGAAGAVESLACVLAIVNSTVPPTINHFTDDPDIDPRLNLTFNEAQPREIRYAMNNAFGFGGHNTTIIFKKHN